MTLSELYIVLGGDVHATLARIPSETMIQKFAKMYTQDTSFAELRQAVGACDWDGAFRAAHTLKGVALNLGFSYLADAASALTEHLRGGNALIFHGAAAAARGTGALSAGGAVAGGLQISTTQRLIAFPLFFFFLRLIDGNFCIGTFLIRLLSFGVALPIAFNQRSHNVLTYTP